MEKSEPESDSSTDVALHGSMGVLISTHIRQYYSFLQYVAAVAVKFNVIFTHIQILLNYDIFIVI